MHTLVADPCRWVCGGAALGVETRRRERSAEAAAIAPVQ